MEEDLNYLKNFWDHKLGDTVNEDIITYMDPKYPEQVCVSGSPDIQYIQDLEWNPSDRELKQLIENFGIKVLSDSLFFLNTFQEMPKNIKDFATAVRNFRLIGLSQGVDIFAPK